MLSHRPGTWLLLLLVVLVLGVVTRDQWRLGLDTQLLVMLVEPRPW